MALPQQSDRPPFESNGAGPSESVKLVPLDRLLLPIRQPRRYFDAQAMQELTASIRENGILQPLLVRSVGDKYEVVAGGCRYRAAVALGLTTIPVMVREMTDMEALQYALVENLQRCDLNPVEETEAILQLLELRLSSERAEVISLLNHMANRKRGFTDSAVRNEQQQLIESVFQSLGRLSPESFRTHRLPLLNLPPEILAALTEGRIEWTKAKEIAKLESDSERVALLEEAVAQSLTLRQIQKLVKEKKAQKQLPELEVRLRDMTNRAKKFNGWDNPDKRTQLESLLAQMEALLSDEE